MSSDRERKELTELDAIFATNVRRIREAQGLSQVALANRANMSGSRVSEIECGRSSSTIYTISKIAEALSVHPTALLMDVAKTKPIRKPIE